MPVPRIIESHFDPLVFSELLMLWAITVINRIKPNTVACFSDASRANKFLIAFGRMWIRHHRGEDLGAISTHDRSLSCIWGVESASQSPLQELSDGKKKGPSPY